MEWQNTDGKGKVTLRQDVVERFYSGGERAGQNGVAIYLSKRAAQSLMGYNPVNDRLISVRLRGQAKNVKLIQVYAPTSSATDEEIETFYETLQQEINNKDRQDILIISGDLNAKVGAKQNVEEDGIVGNAGLGERNELLGDTYLLNLQCQTNWQ